MYPTINPAGNVNNAVDGLNATDKNYLKEQMEIIDKLESNDILKIGMLLSLSNYVSIKLSDQCLRILNDEVRLNGQKKIKNAKGRINIQISIVFLQRPKEQLC